MPRRALTNGEKFTKRVKAQYDIADDSALADTLRLAAAALDRAQQAQKEIDEHGLLVSGLHGMKQNSAVPILRDAEASFLRFTRAMGLYDVETD